jgi:hypothetical protein
VTSTVPQGSRDLVRDVQRFGLFSAAAVVARYTEIVDRAIAGDPLLPAVDLPDGHRAGPPPGLALEVARAVLGLVDSVAAMLRTSAPDGSHTGAVVLPPAPPGSGSEVALWLHNTTSSTAPVIDLHGTGLVSSDGHRIAAGGVELVPDRVEALVAGSAREVRLRVSIPPGQPTGLYHGLVLNSAAPAEPMAVLLEVGGP